MKGICSLCRCTEDRKEDCVNHNFECHKIPGCLETEVKPDSCCPQCSMYLISKLVVVLEGGIGFLCGGVQLRTRDKGFCGVSYEQENCFSLSPPPVPSLNGTLVHPKVTLPLL